MHRSVLLTSMKNSEGHRGHKGFQSSSSPFYSTNSSCDPSIMCTPMKHTSAGNTHTHTQKKECMGWQGYAARQQPSYLLYCRQAQWTWRCFREAGWATCTFTRMYRAGGPHLKTVFSSSHLTDSYRTIPPSYASAPIIVSITVVPRPNCAVNSISPHVFFL